MILKMFIKLILKGSQSRLKAKIWRDLSEIAHEKILDQKYEYFLGTNNTDISATVLMNINRVADGLGLEPEDFIDEKGYKK